MNEVAKCFWAITAVCVALTGCALLESARAVTPAQRASAYKAHARGIDTLCAAYTFDRAAGLVGEVPDMTRACGEEVK